MKELDIPAGADGEDGAVEMIRFWLANGQDHVALNVGMFAKAEEPGCWGMIAADIVKHAIRVMLEKDPSRERLTLIGEVTDAFHQRMAHNVKNDDTLSGRSQ